LKRLQEVSVGIIAPIDQLQANPLPNAVRKIIKSSSIQRIFLDHCLLQVALVNLQDAVRTGLPPLPPQAIRFAVKLTGLEPAHMYGTLKSLLVLAGKVIEIEIESIVYFFLSLISVTLDAIILA
jgi:hypothetical protein